MNPVARTRKQRLDDAWTRVAQREVDRQLTVPEPSAAPFPADALVPTTWEAAGVLSAVVLGIMFLLCLGASLAHWCG